MTKFVRDFVSDETGAAAAEYALILAIVGAGIAAAAFLLGGNVSKAMTGAANNVCPGTGVSGGLC